jgi:FkbM family methyltransferase
MRRLYNRKGVSLENLSWVQKDRFYLYQINGTYLPNETLHEDMSQDWLLQKAKNESLHFYVPGKNDVVLDLGAGLGEETVLLSALVGPEGRVISIEANPSVYKALSEMVRLNRLNNVIACQYAIGPSNGSVRIHSPHGSYESGFVTGESQNSFATESITLGSVMDKFHTERIDFLKSNIEGAERYLADLPADYFKKIRNVAIACHDFRLKNESNEFFRTREQVKRALEENGFRVSQRQTGVDYLDDWLYGSRNFA